MAALAGKIQSRGHEAVFFGMADAESSIRAAGLNFVSEYPIGSVAQIWGPVRQLRGLAAIGYSGKHIRPTFLENTLKQLPAALEKAHVDALVIDTAFAFVELAAMKMDLPYVQAWLVLNFDASGSTPSNLFSWPLEKSAEATSRNLEG